MKRNEKTTAQQNYSRKPQINRHDVSNNILKFFSTDKKITFNRTRHAIYRTECVYCNKCYVFICKQIFQQVPHLQIFIIIYRTVTITSILNYLQTGFRIYALTVLRIHFEQYFFNCVVHLQLINMQLIFSHVSKIRTFKTSVWETEKFIQIKLYEQILMKS